MMAPLGQFLFAEEEEEKRIEGGRMTGRAIESEVADCILFHYYFPSTAAAQQMN